jgi:hypothetical protein
MSRRVVSGILMVASLLLASPAARADDDGLPAARKLAEMTGMLTTMQAQGESLTGFIKAALAQANPRQGVEVEDVVEQYVAPTVQKNIPALLDATTKLYAATFTRDEIDQMIAFYDTPLGRKIIKTMPQLQRSGIAVGMEWGKRVLGEMTPELKKKLEERGLNPPQEP